MGSRSEWESGVAGLPFLPKMQQEVAPGERQGVEGVAIKRGAEQGGRSRSGPGVVDGTNSEVTASTGSKRRDGDRIRWETAQGYVSA